MTQIDDFKKLYKALFPRLVAYAVRFTKDEDVAKDIVQESFLKFYDRKELTALTSGQSIMFVIVRNSCLDFLRHKKVVKLESIDYLAHLGGEERLYHVDFGFTPSEQLVCKELQSQIDTVLESLPPKCKEVFIMSRFEGLKNKDIAEKMGTSVTNVEKHITKALKRFSKYLEEHYPVETYIAILAWLLQMNNS